MCRNIEESYIPSCTCAECLQNKSCTTKPAGPLHPLPILDGHGDSIVMDFISPLPVDEGYNCILSILDHIGLDVHIVPTCMNITAEELATIFFDNWYCENGLPKDIVSDCNKLFVSHFWKALTKLSGIKLKMSAAYHPETDGSNERSNKTIDQMLRYHVQRNQKGWVRALLRIHFQIMNSVNASTNFSGFQLHLSRSPQIIPPIIPLTLPDELVNAGKLAIATLDNIETDVVQARDNLLHAKIQQAHHASASCSADLNYSIGNAVMLSTFNRPHKFKKASEKRTAKFFPRWDGPY
jgi:hypothetical protein